MKVTPLLGLAFALAFAGCGAAPIGDGTPASDRGARGPNLDARVPFGGLSPTAWEAAPVAPPPISLVSGDGKALELRVLEADTVVDGPLAFTELRMTFHNPEARRIEGRFRIALPPGASVSRFAMKIGERWQEGEIVEKQRATKAYEDFLHRRVDPALLEQGAGNELDARVFPIEAGEDKQLVLSYSQELHAAPTPVIPLAGMPAIDRVEVHVFGAGAAAPELSRRRYRPSADIALSAAGEGLVSEDRALLRLRPPSRPAAAPLADVMLLVDTSASRALDLGAQIRFVRELARRVDGALVIAAFDQRVEEVFRGRARDLGEQPLERLARRGALGASDLEAALRWAADTAPAAKARRLILVGDGVITAGDHDGRSLGAAVEALGRAGIQRLDAVAFGGLRDDELLERLVTGELEQHGVLARALDPLERTLMRLSHGVRSVPIRVEGATWWWPRVAHGLAPGDEVLVYATLDDGARPRVYLDDREQPLRIAPAREAELLERAWARARIASLLDEERREGASDRTARAIVELSTRHRVLSPYTSLLVLEQDWHYDRYGIDRQARSDILTVAGGKLEVLARSAPARGSTSPRGDDHDASGTMLGEPIGDSFGAGGLGLSGVAEDSGRGSPATRDPGRLFSPPTAPAASGQGFGGGRDRLAPRHRTRAPRVRMGATQVSGRIPPEVIRRVVRQRFGTLRGCYEAALLRKPGLGGRIAVRFVIDRAGTAIDPSLQRSDLGDPEMERCLLAAFGQMKFPAPVAGRITVVYPLVFSPSDGASHPPVNPSLRTNRSARPRMPTEAPKPQPPKLSRPFTGTMARIMDGLAAGAVELALAEAARWHDQQPGELVPLVALGEALEAAGERDWAARAYGSIIDLFPSRTDFRRYAGARLERVGALGLAADTYRVAREQRPDHPSSHRHYAYALLKQGRHAEAFAVLQQALSASVTWERYPSVERVLREDLGLIAAAWIDAVPSQRARILGELAWAGAELSTQPSLRFVLTWETDANDVDLHVYDAAGGHAFYQNRSLGRGGRLYDDVTRGYGPECFAVAAPPAARAPSYRLQAHYYARGPMGYGMGKVQVVEHDGNGRLAFDERPFLVMVDDGYVDLGEVSRTLL